MVQRGAIVKDGNGYTDYALDVVQGDGSVKVGDVVEWTIINAHKGPPGLVIPQDTTHPSICIPIISRSSRRQTATASIMMWATGATPLPCQPRET